MKKHNFLAFDIGATSGRAVLVSLMNGKFEMRELHRKYYWNIYNLYEELKKSLSLCAREDIPVDSIGIDTWGVDFGYLA